MPPVRRIRRILINALTILSLLPCVATCVLWARSSHHVYYSHGWDDGREVTLSSSGSGMYFYGKTENFYGTFRAMRGKPPTGWLFDHGFEWTHNRRLIQLEDGTSLTEHFLLATVPHWFIASVTSLLPIAYGIGRFARSGATRQQPRGHCPECGYDLHSTPARCPESGAVPSTKAVA